MTFHVRGLQVRASPWLAAVVIPVILLGRAPQFSYYLLLLLAHELAHIMAASAVGVEIEGLEIWPFGGRLTIHGLERDPAAEALVSLAGPLHNLILLALALMVAGAFPVSQAGLGLFVSANLGLALANLLPFPPLDGGRALLAFLGAAAGRRQAVRALSLMGRLFSLGVVVMGLVALAAGAPPGAAAAAAGGGLLLFVACISESRRINVSRDPVLDLVGKQASARAGPRRLSLLSAPESMAVRDLCRDFSPRRSYLVWVIGADGRTSGPLTETQLLTGLLQQGPRVTLGELLLKR